MRVRARSRVKRDLSADSDWRKANVTFKRRVQHLYETGQLFDIEFHVHSDCNISGANTNTQSTTKQLNGHASSRSSPRWLQTPASSDRESRNLTERLQETDYVGGKLVVRAHRLVVAMASEELQQLVYPSNDGSQLPASIDVVCNCPTAFRDMISFVYTGECQIDVVERARDIFNVAKKFRYQSLIVFISKFISDAVNNFRFTPRTCGNLLFFLEFLIELQEPVLLETCWSLMDRYAARIVSTDEFLRLDRCIFSALMRRETFEVGDELVKFLTIKRWADRKHEAAESTGTGHGRSLRDNAGDLMQFIRLDRISETDFIKSVIPSGLIGPEEVISFFMTSGISIPRSLDLYNTASAARTLVARRPQHSNIFDRCLRFRTGFRLPIEMLSVPHEVRLQVDTEVMLDGICLGYVFSQLEMGVTVRVQGPFERVQWSDMYSQYCPVTGDAGQRGHADIRVFFRQPVRLEAGLCYKIMAKIDRWTLTGEELGLWGGQSGPSRVRTTGNLRVYFLEAAVEKGHDIPFANMEKCRGLITELLFSLR